jgi:hypothetical protein
MKKGGNVLDVSSHLFIQKLAEFFKVKDLLKLPKVNKNNNKIYSGEH